MLFFFLIYYKIKKSIFGISAIIKYLRNPEPKFVCPSLLQFGAKVGSRTRFKRNILLDNVYSDKDSTGDFSNIDIGNNCYIGDSIYLDLANKIVLEDNVVISGRVSIVTHSDCNRSPYLSKKFPRSSARVKVEEGAWIGFGTIILSGVTIGKNSVIAAGSVITENIPSYSVYGGIPARKIKDIDE